MFVGAVALDDFKDLKYAISDRKASHQAPYAKVYYKGDGVAKYLLKTKVLEFYDDVPKEALAKKSDMLRWFDKPGNYQQCVKYWNQYNPGNQV